MTNRESSAVTDFISAVRRPISDNGSGAHPRLVSRAPAQQAAPPEPHVAHGTPAPQWAQSPRARARGTLPPPIPADARKAAPLPIPGQAAPPPIPAQASAPRPHTWPAPAQPAPPPIPSLARPAVAPPPIPGQDRRPDHPALSADTVPAPRIAEAALEMSWYDEDDEPTHIAPALMPVQARAVAEQLRDERPARADATEIAVMPGRSRWPIVVGVAGGLIGAAAIAAYIATSGAGVAAPSAASPAALAAGERSTPAPAAVVEQPAAEPPAAIEPTPAVEPAAIPALEPAVTSVGPTVAFISEPAGATVTLIEDGVPHVIGETPIEAIIDPERHYEAMFALAGHATTLQPVTLTEGAARIEVTLQDASAAAEEPATPEVTRSEPKKVRDRPTRRERSRRSARSERRSRSRSDSKAERKVASTPAGAYGLLALGAKPPCDIYIDGKNTGLQTPQRSIKLAPGKHKVTLINRDHDIRKSFSVRIKAGKRTRAIQDLTDRID